MCLKMTKLLSGFGSCFYFCFSSQMTATFRLQLQKHRGQMFLQIFTLVPWSRTSRASFRWQISEEDKGTHEDFTKFYLPLKKANQEHEQ